MPVIGLFEPPSAFKYRTRKNTQLTGKCTHTLAEPILARPSPTSSYSDSILDVVSGKGLRHGYRANKSHNTNQKKRL